MIVQLTQPSSYLCVDTIVSSEQAAGIGPLMYRHAIGIQPADIDHMGPAVKETGAWVHIARMLRSLGGG